MKADDDREEGGDDAAVTGETVPLATGGDLPTPEPVEVGAFIAGRYVLEKMLGGGGAGQVFVDFDRALNEQVAVKVLRPDRSMDRSWIRRLAREVKVARLIRH